MKIIVISVGKIKEKYLVSAIEEYSKRLSKYIQLDQIEIKDEATKENASEKEIDAIKLVEGKRILDKIPKDSYVVTLEIEGKQLSSIEFASLFETIGTYHSSSVTFIIGGSLGLSSEVSALSQYKLSFSKMTFPHQLMKVILLEQIYRAFRINNNEPYHK